MVGYTLKELEPINIETLTKLTHPDDLVKLNELAQLHFEGKTDYYRLDFRIKHKDGSWVWVYDQGKVVEWTKDGKPLKMFGTHTDITQRKQAEITVRLSEDKLRSIVENSTDQIFMLDGDYRFILANKSTVHLSGLSIQEMIGRSISEVFPETIAAQFSKNIKNVFGTGKSMLLDEKIVVNGQELYISTSLNPVQDALGRVIAVTGIVRYY